MLDALKSQLQEEGEVTFSVNVRPNAGKTAAKGFLEDGTMKIDIAAAPEDGKANVELIRFLSREFGVTRDRITLRSGETSRRKTIVIQR